RTPARRGASARPPSGPNPSNASFAVLGGGLRLRRSLVPVAWRSQCTSGADRGPFNQEVERALLPEREAEAIQVAVLLEQRAHRGCRSLARLRDALDLGIDVGVARHQPFLFGDGLDQERSLHGLLGARPH